MLNYYLKLSWHNFKRARVLYILVTLTLAIGVGLLCANLALVNTMASDPLPQKSDKVFHISMNTWPEDDPYEQPFHLTRYRDGRHITESQIPTHTAVFYETSSYTRATDSKSIERFQSTIRATTPGFFALTDAPFAYGAGFTKDTGFEVVIGHELNLKLFDGKDSVGKSIELSGKSLQVVGVLQPWFLRPLFYHASEGRAFNATDDIFMPLETAIDMNLSVSGRSSATERVDGTADSRQKQSFYLHAWVQLDTPEQQQAFQAYLDNYGQSLKENGEHPNEVINHLNDVNAWLTKQDVVDDKVLAFTIATALFLCVCIFNASSLLLSRFHAAKFEIGLRRAIGASKRQMFQQGLVESLTLGMVSGLLALLLSWLFLKVSVSFLPHLANIAILEPSLLMLGVLLAMFTSVASSMYPLFRANRYTISAELKS